MQRKTIAKLAFLVLLLVLMLQISAPQPGAALTCSQECRREYYGCLHGCGFFCIGDDACLAACNAGCDDDLSSCLSGC